MQKITKRQLELLHAIEETASKNGVPPTIAELKKQLNVSSDQSIYQLLQKLEEAGLVERESGKRRSIRLINKKPSPTTIGSSPTYSSSNNSMPSFTMETVQKNIFDKLHEIDPQVAIIYKGALFTMAQRAYHPDWIAQAANSLRGIFGTLTRGENQEGAITTTDTGVQKISKVFDPHGVIVKFEKAAWDHWNKLNSYFAGVSHYNEGYETEEKEFLKKVEEFNDLLAKYVLPNQFDIYEQMDKFIKSGSEKISVDELSKYLSRNTATYTYFFSNIDFSWFEFLKSHKLLRPSHQVGEYLVRVSTVIPDQIVQLGKQYNTDYKLSLPDKFIRRYFISAAIVMPFKNATEIVELMIKQKWVEETTHGNDFIFFDAKKLLEKLLSNKQYQTAQLLVKELLDVKVNPEKQKTFREVGAYIDNYFYGEIIKSLQAVSGEELLTFIQTLVSIFDKAVKLTTDKDNQYFHIWRSHIGDKDRLRYDVVDSIIDGLRDLSVQYLDYLKKSKKNPATAIDNLFSQTDSDIITRIKLYLYAKYPLECLEKIQWMIIEQFDNHRVEREYDDLIKQEFSNINPTFQKKYLDLVDKGPIEKKELEDERYKKFWKLRKLIIIKEHLDTIWKKKYQDLLGGEDESKLEPRYSGQITSFHGPTASKNSVELDSMATDALIGYLAKWEPIGGFGEPSRMGLGREMSEAIKKNPIKYSKDAMLFNNDALHPVYLYQYFFGLKESLKSDHQIEWGPVVELMTAIIGKAKKDQLLKFKPEEDDWNVDWSSVFQHMADLLENGLTSSKSELPFDLRQKIWAIIEHVCEDKEPDVEYEKKYGGTNSDYYTLSINTTRGEAFHALFNYIFWCDKNTKVKSGSRIPDEAKKVLENHLKLETEPGLTIRSVYGRFFPWLYIYDKTWTKEIVEKIFPLNDLPRRYAAWETYLTNAVYPEIFEDLRPQYAKAIEELKKPSLKKTSRSVDPFERLIDHMMIAYAYNVIEYDDALLKSFYEEANREQKGVGTNFMGRVYIASENATRDHDPDKKRLQKFWQSRLNESETIEELMEFGWWVKDDYFDNEWMLQKLLETLNKTNGAIEPRFRVLETLKGIAANYPLLVSQCLLKIVRSKRQDQFLHMATEEDIKNIVEILHNNEDEQVRKIISQVSDQMLRLGNNDFRIFIKPADQPMIPSGSVKNTSFI